MGPLSSGEWCIKRRVGTVCKPTLTNAGLYATLRSQAAVDIRHFQRQLIHFIDHRKRRRAVHVRQVVFGFFVYGNAIPVNTVIAGFDQCPAGVFDAVFSAVSIVVIGFAIGYGKGGGQNTAT